MRIDDVYHLCSVFTKRKIRNSHKSVKYWIHLQCMKCVSKNPCIRHSFPFRVVIVKMDTLTVEILLRIPFIQFTRHFLPAQFSDTWKFRGKNTCHVLWRINNSEPGSFSQWESERFRTKYVLRFVNL